MPYHKIHIITVIEAAHRFTATYNRALNYECL